MWRQDGAELLLLLNSSSDEDSVVLGVLDESVVCLSEFGVVRVTQPGNRTRTVETQLENSQRRLTLVKSVTLPKRGKVFVVSEEGFLYQVRRPL